MLLLTSLIKYLGFQGVLVVALCLPSLRCLSSSQCFCSVAVSIFPASSDAVTCCQRHLHTGNTEPEQLSLTLTCLGNKIPAHGTIIHWCVQLFDFHVNRYTSHMRLHVLRIMYLEQASKDLQSHYCCMKSCQTQINTDAVLCMTTLWVHRCYYLRVGRQTVRQMEKRETERWRFLNLLEGLTTMCLSIQKVPDDIVTKTSLMGVMGSSYNLQSILIWTLKSATWA